MDILLMSEQPNVNTPSANLSYELIRLGFFIIGGLAASLLIIAVVPDFKELNPAVLTVVSSVITGFFGFLAGRKK